LNGSVFKDDDANRIKQISNTTVLSGTEIFNLLNNFRIVAKKRSLDFDTPGALNDVDYHRLTGISARDFNNLVTYISDKIRSSSIRSVRTCLALFLIKLRTGMSHSILSSLFGIQRRTIGKSIHSARKALMEDFVPNHLGLNHITRDDFIRLHTRDMAKNLFAEGKDVAILVADGTYMYIEKSSNYSFQRRSFSMHKGRPLVKPMMIVSTTGYILDVFGPYFADGKNNDANILNSLMKKRGSLLLEWLWPEDVMVVDRGFRDSITTLEEYGLIPKMPHFLEIGKQHNTMSANESRIVTKIRWIVESVNGLIKTWKMLANVFPNTQIPYIGDYVRIVSALCNAYRPPRVQVTSPHDEIIAQRMLALSRKPNDLQKKVEDKRWLRKTTIWEKIEATSIRDFPRLTLEDLHRITIGIYQIKQAASYTREHMAEDGNYVLYVHKQEADILRVKLQSRHTSSKQYQLWIRYEKDGSDPIKGWYCQCKTGARTVGCCAHIASVLWYLGYYRYMENTSQYHSDAYPEYEMDAVTWSETDESEDDV